MPRSRAAVRLAAVPSAAVLPARLAPHLLPQSRTQLAVLASEPACWIPLLLSLGMATLVAGSGSLSIPAVNLPLFYALGYGGLQSYAMSLVLVNAGALGGALDCCTAACRRRECVSCVRAHAAAACSVCGAKAWPQLLPGACAALTPPPPPAGALVALALADTLGRRLGVAACMFAASAAFGSLALLLQLLYGPALAAGGPLPLLPPSHGWAAAVLLMLAHVSTCICMSQDCAPQALLSSR